MSATRNTLFHGLAAFCLTVMVLVVAAPVPRANAVNEVILPDEGLLNVETGKGHLVRLDRAAATVFVAEPEIADVQVKSPTLIYVFGKKVGETTLYAVDAADRVILARILSVTHDLSRMRMALDQLIPNNAIRIASISGALILDGMVANATEAEDVRRLAARFITDKEEVINRLQVSGPNQINLRVKIAEVSRSIVKDFGFNWTGTLSALSGFTYGLSVGNIATAGLSSLGGSLSSSGSKGKFTLDSVIDALETDGLVTVLAEPNLTALSGETASFLAGGEFPIPVPQGNNTISIELKKFGVSLSFTPTMVGDNRISLKVRPEVSQLDFTNAVTTGGFKIPSLTTRRAETTVELGSGQSFAIAGLLQNNVGHNVDEVPGLANIPILGALFRSDNFQRDETELMIIVSPYIVRPVSHTKLALPTDGLVMPTDGERLFTGDLYRSHPPGAVVAAAPIDHKGRRLAGPVGFMLE